ncbi:hypothetical protein ZWY2020_018130 [Hordeum vulgare]|nr:hypothetical protein ZWY2020_018130 [Hordeum vulgare]
MPARPGLNGLRAELRDYDQPEVEAIRWEALVEPAEGVVLLRHVGGRYHAPTEDTPQASCGSPATATSLPTSVSTGKKGRAPTIVPVVLVELCVFNSKTEKWQLFLEMRAPQPQDESNGGQFPILWETNDVLALDGRFLCYVDRLSGVLLCDFSDDADSPVLHFVSFP